MWRRCVSNADNRSQFWALYLTRFAEGFGFITLLTLLPTYINTLDPQATTVLGVTISAGLVIGMYTTGFTLVQTAAVVPLAWAGDRFDKRTVLLVVLAAGALVYALFPLVDSSGSFIAIRALQGLVVTGASLMTLSLVGQIADFGTRADRIGKANAASFAASIVGSLSAGAIYDAVGFGPVFSIITALMVVAWVGTWGVLEPDSTRVDGWRCSRTRAPTTAASHRASASANSSGVPALSRAPDSRMADGRGEHGLRLLRRWRVRDYRRARLSRHPRPRPRPR